MTILIEEGIDIVQGRPPLVSKAVSVIKIPLGVEDIVTPLGLCLLGGKAEIRNGMGGGTIVMMSMSERRLQRGGGTGTKMIKRKGLQRGTEGDLS